LLFAKAESTYQIKNHRCGGFLFVAKEAKQAKESESHKASRPI